MIFWGSNFKCCKAFGGSGVDGATNSDCYDYGWEELSFLLVSSGRSMVYLPPFLVVFVKKNMLLRYINSKSWTFRLGFGVNRGLVEGVAPKMHSILGCSRVGHLQCGR